MPGLDYRQIGTLADGPYLRTFLATEPGGQLVVVKQSLGTNQLDVNLGREATMLTRLQGLEWSPGRPWGLPRLLSSGETEVVRTYCPGLTLSQLIQLGPLPTPQVAAWMQRLQQLIQEIHARDCWHGDLSPANILITPDNSVILLDWGSPCWGTPPFREASSGGPDSDLQALVLLNEQLFGTVHPPPGRDLARLLGRNFPLERLKKSWSNVAESESVWVGIQAESGGGKSALLRELHWLTPHRVWGQASTLTTPIGFNLFQSLVETMQSDIADVAALRQDAPRWQQMSATFPRIANSSTGKSVQSSLASIHLAQAWKELLLELAQRHPLLILLDDIQWMDESSRNLLHSLSRAQIPGLMVVMAWRQEEYTLQAGLRLDYVLELPPLQRQDVFDWCQRDQATLTESQVSQLAEWTQGSPLLISECLAQPDSPNFSSKAGALLEDRLSRLDPEMTQVLQVSALIGSYFTDEPLVGLGFSPTVLDRAESLQLLLPGRRFSHDKVRESILAGMSQSNQVHWHEQLGGYFAQQPRGHYQAAFHYAHARQHQKAYPFALVAARADAATSALSSAAYYYDICCQHRAEPETIWEQARVLELLGHQSKARKILTTALETQDCGPWRSRLSLTLAMLHRKGSRCGEAVYYSQEAWRHLSRLPREASKALEPEILTSLLETRYERNELFRFWLDLATRLPSLGKNHMRAPLLRANLTLALAFTGIRCGSRKLRKVLLQAVRCSDKPLLWAQVTSRLSVFRFAEGSIPLHRRLLARFVSIYELHGEPWELCMNLMQSGLYAAVCGDFQELHQLARRIEDIVQITEDPSQDCVGAQFATAASGGRVSWNRLLELDNLSVYSMGACHRVVAQAQYLLRSSRPSEALERLKKVSSPNPIDGSLVRAWHATAARQTADQTPRRWSALRGQYYREAIKEAKRALAYGRFARIHAIRAYRELGLAYLGLGQSEAGRLHLQRSFEAGAALGARYEEALSRKAWAEAAELLGWPDAEQNHSRAQASLRELGAWWDLAPDQWTPGLPLQEVGEAAALLLGEPNEQASESLKRWASQSWIEQIKAIVADAQDLRRALETARQEHQRQNERWQAFLENGPVLLDDTGETESLRLPPQHSKLELCVTLLESEIADLQGILHQHLVECQTSPHGAYRDQLLESMSNLTNWTKADEPPAVEGVWFVRGLNIQVDGKIPWQRLSSRGRQAFAGILREGLQNCRKHQPDQPISIDFQTHGSTFSMVLAARPQLKEILESQAGFGLSSMVFRASLAGGSIRLDSSLKLELRLPLLDLPL